MSCDVKGQEGPVSSYGKVVEILSNELDDVKKAKISWFYSKEELVELVGPRRAPFLSCLEPCKDEVYLSAHSELFSLECVARKAPHFPCLCLTCAKERMVQNRKKRKSFRLYSYRAVVDVAKGITSGKCEKCGQYSFCLEDRENSMTPTISTNTTRPHSTSKSLARPLSNPNTPILQPRLCASARPNRKFASLMKNADNTSASRPQHTDISLTVMLEQTPCGKRRKLCREEDILVSLTGEMTPVKPIKKTGRRSACRKLDLDLNDSDSEDPLFNIKDHADGSDDPFEFNSESEDDKDFASPPLRRKTVTPSRQRTRERGRRPGTSAPKTPLTHTPGRGSSKRASPLTVAKQSCSRSRLKNVTLSLPKRTIPESIGLDDYQLAQER